MPPSILSTLHVLTHLIFIYLILMIVIIMSAIIIAIIILISQMRKLTLRV